MKSKLLFIIFLLSIAYSNAAEKLILSASKNPVTEGENFQVQFTLYGDGDRFQGPDFKPFKIVKGPERISTNTIINDRKILMHTFIYLLKAPNVGSFTINPGYVDKGKRKIYSNKLNISVLKYKDYIIKVEEEKKKREAELQSKAEKVINNILFIKTFVDKPTVTIGEPVIVKFVAYYTKEIIKIKKSELTKTPILNGFWIKKIIDSSNYEGRQIVNGIPYITKEVMSFIVVPQITGNLVIDPMEIQTKALLATNRNILGNYIISSKEFSTIIKSPQVEIKVLPTKEPVADNFSNIVGSYTLESTIDKRKVKTNEPISLKLIVKGKGNLNFLEPPKFSNNPDLEFYDPKITDNIDYNNTISGTRTIEYIIIPRNAGKFDLEQLVVNYFDLKSRNYVELKSDKYSIEVEQGVYNDPTIQSTPLVKLQFIQNENQTRLKDKYSYLIASPFYYVLLCLPIGLIGFIWYKSKKKSQENSDIIGTKKKNAINIAKKRLSLANKYLSEGSQALFLEEILKASWLYFSDKMNIPISELSKDALSDLLKQKKVEEADINLVLEHIDNVEFHRYTPMVEDAARKELYLKTNDIIVKFEELL